MSGCTDVSFDVSKVTYTQSDGYNPMRIYMPWRLVHLLGISLQINIIGLICNSSLAANGCVMCSSLSSRTVEGRVGCDGDSDVFSSENWAPDNSVNMVVNTETVLPVFSVVCNRDMHVPFFGNPTAVQICPHPFYYNKGSNMFPPEKPQMRLTACTLWPSQYHWLTMPRISHLGPPWANGTNKTWRAAHSQPLLFGVQMIPWKAEGSKMRSHQEGRS